MSAKSERDTTESAQVDTASGPADFMEPEPPILANEVATLVDCFKVRINDPLH